MKRAFTGLPSAIWNREARNPTITVVDKLAVAFGVKVGALLEAPGDN